MRTPEQIEELLDRLEPIIKEYDGAKDRFDRGEWSKKFGDRFGKYSDKLKKLNGDDFDIMNESYDEYHKDYSDLTDDDYANALEENVKKVLSRIWPDEPEKVEEAVQQVTEPDTEVSIEVEAKPEDDTITSDEDLKRTTGPWKNPCDSGGRDGKCGLPGRGKPKGTIRSDEDSKVDPTESFVKELEEYKANMPRRK